MQELINEISMGPFGSDIKKSVYTNSGVPVLNGSNLQGFTLKENTFGYVSEEKADSLKKCNAHRGDIIVTHRGTLGQIVYIPNNSLFERYVISQSQFRFNLKPELARAEFIVYYFHTREGQYKILSNASQVGVPALARATTTFRQLEVKVPPLPVQDKIVGILSALDAKIENNNKINANLEAQAEALFKSWFVDFTPFKDQPFVDSELGPIPQGWKVVSLDEVCLKITDGSHFSPKDNPKEKIPMLSVKDMRKHGFDYQSCKHITESDFFKLQKNDCVPHVNDLLVAKDGSYLKEIFLCKKEIKQAILSSIAIFRPNTKLILPEYLLHYLKQPQVLKDVRDNYVSGSAVPRIVLKDFKKLKLCIPPMNSISTYRELLKSIEQLLLQKTEENQRLAALRDTLLPKLMSGEIKL